jgi:hypothetical protein
VAHTAKLFSHDHIICGSEIQNANINLLCSMRSEAELGNQIAGKEWSPYQMDSSPAILGHELG